MILNECEVKDGKDGVLNAEITCVSWDTQDNNRTGQAFRHPSKPACGCAHATGHMLSTNLCNQKHNRVDSLAAATSMPPTWTGELIQVLVCAGVMQDATDEFITHGISYTHIWASWMHCAEALTAL